MAKPIWKDEFATLDADSITYRIKVTDTAEVIYTGKATRKPNAPSILIHLNEVCADYLKHTLPSLSQAEFTRLSIPVQFDVDRLVGSSWQTIKVVSFLNDWSYDYNYDAETDGMAFPINGKVDARQWLFYTIYNSSQETITLTYTDGTTSQVIVPIARSNDFNNDFNADFSRSLLSAGSGTLAIDLSAWENLAKVSIDGREYKVTDSCRKYVVHYINAFGGWDSLLIEGNHIMEDSIDRKTMKVVYDNAVSRNSGTNNYLNEIDRTITLHTGFMSDDQSSRMHHLLNSTKVYLEDIEEKRFYPVTLDTNSHTYKTFRNQGGMVSYDFVVRIAHDMQRR